MRALLIAALGLAATPALPSPAFSPDLLPKLIGSSALLIEKELGAPTDGCRNGMCTHALGGQEIGLAYQGGLVSAVSWMPVKGPWVTMNDLKLRTCKGPFVDWVTGGEVWNDCAGGLSAKIDRDAGKKTTFSVEIRAGKFLTR